MISQLTLRCVSYSSGLLFGLLFSRQWFLSVFVLITFGLVCYWDLKSFFGGGVSKVRTCLLCVSFLVFLIFEPSLILSVLGVLVCCGFVKFWTFSYRFFSLLSALLIFGHVFQFLNLAGVVFFSTTLLLILET